MLSRGDRVGVLLGNSVKVVGPLLDFPFHASRKFSIPPRFSLPSIRPLVRKPVRVKVLSRMEHPPSLEAQDVYPFLREDGSLDTLARPRPNDNHDIRTVTRHLDSLGSYK